MTHAFRLRMLAVAAAGMVLAACGQKGPLTLPDTSGATPIVIREAAPPTAPAPAPANPTPPQR